MEKILVFTKFNKIEDFNLCLSTLNRKYNHNGEYFDNWIRNYVSEKNNFDLFVVDEGDGYSYGRCDKNLNVWKRNPDTNELENSEIKLEGDITYINHFIYNRNCDIAKLYRKYVYEDLLKGHIKIQLEENNCSENKVYFIIPELADTVINPFTKETDDNLSGFEVSWESVDLDLQYDSGTYISVDGNGGWYEKPGYYTGDDPHLEEPEVKYLWEDEEISKEQYAEINKIPIDIIPKIEQKAIAMAQEVAIEYAEDNIAF